MGLEVFDRCEFLLVLGLGVEEGRELTDQFESSSLIHVLHGTIEVCRVLGDQLLHDHVLCTLGLDLDWSDILWPSNLFYHLADGFEADVEAGHGSILPY